MARTPDEFITELVAKTPDREAFIRAHYYSITASILREQITWARLQLVKAEKDELHADECAWTGYLNALHWVEDCLLNPDVPLFSRGKPATAPIEGQEQATGAP